MPAITPYQDPAYGERPAYDRYDQTDQRTREREQAKEMLQQQDEVMTDIYDGMPTESENASILEDGDE